MRPNQRIARSALPALLCVVGSGLPAQQQTPQQTPSKPVDLAVFDVRRPPRGTVRDVAGKPIAGADVYFRTENDSLDSVQWRNFILRTQPLPRVRTGRDGEFFLPLTHLHRLFSPLTSGQISLVVEKPGYHPWVEPLGAGLRGYLGSNVVLAKVTVADRFTIRVTNPQPGMLVRVHRFASGSVPGVELERFYEVPASGVVEAAVSFVPTPVALGVRSNLVTPIGIEVQLLFPGRSTPGIPLGYGQRKVKIGDKVPSSQFVCVLRRPGGKRPVKPRGLYRCPDGVSRWFPIDPENVVESEYLRVVALLDDGCVASNIRYVDPSIETIRLAAVTEESGRALELHAKSGELIEDALVYFFDLRHLASHDAGTKLGAERARRRLMVSKGRVDLSARSVPGPGFLYIQAVGFKPLVYFDPRDIVGRRRLSLGKRFASGKLRLTVHDVDDRPVQGAYVSLLGNSFDLGTYNGGLLRTNASGEVSIDHLPLGNHTVRIVKPGMTLATKMIRLRRSGEVLRQKMTVMQAASFRVLVVDENDRPVPFRPVRCSASVVNNALANVRSQLRTNTVSTTDSAGRLLIQDLPAEVLPRVNDAMTTLGQANINQLEDELGLNRVRLSGTEMVLMPLTDAPIVRECMTVTNRYSNRTVGTRVGCRVALVRFPTGVPSSSLSIHLREGPPMHLTPELIAEARKKQTTGLLHIDQRALSRTVYFDLVGVDDGAVDEMRFELPGQNFNRGRPYLHNDSGLRIKKDKDSRWFLKLRDNAGYAARILHPKYRMQQVEVPARNDKTPLRVEMRRGTPVTFRLLTTRTLRPTYQFYVYVYDETKQMALYQREALGKQLQKVSANHWKVDLPVALAPGKYWFTVRVYGTRLNMPRRQFTVPKDNPLIITVSDTTVRAPRRPVAGPDAAAGTAEIKRYTERIRRLKASTDALRTEGKTDAKSKARLMKVLAELEAQLVQEQMRLRKAQVEQTLREQILRKSSPGKKKEPQKDG